MTRFIKYLIIAFSFNIICGLAAQAATINAASCSSANVQTAITSSSSGDTINVPSGNCTWSSSISLPAAKNLAIIGAGIGNTNITCSSGMCFSIAQNGLSSSSRISGFTFTGGIINLTGLQGNKEFRIDNNRFVLSSPVAMDICSFTDNIHPTGLIDNNQFVNVMIHMFGTCAMLNEGNYQHALWSQTTTLGDYDDVVYIESNSFSGTAGHQNAIDANYGGRYVFRYNTLSGTTYAEVHSIQGGNRAAQRWEIYGNSYSKSLSDWYPIAFVRGGTGVIFNNTATANYTSDIIFNNVRSCRDPGDGVGKCNGTSNWDQNTSGQQGWACRDQIGRIKDNTQFSHTAPGAYSQTLTPAYIWNNIKGSNTQVSVRIDAGESCPGTGGDLNSTHLQANRDYYSYSASFNGTGGVGSGVIANRPPTCTTGVAYWATDEGEWNSNNPGADGRLYKCTSTNTWTLYYTPYAYPHPLRGASVVKPSPPRNLR